MRQKKRKYVEIGSFTVNGTEIRVSDPGYDKEVWCCGTIEDMAPGKYKAFVAYSEDPDWGRRVEMLLIKHASSQCQTRSANYVCSDEDKIYWSYGWERVPITVGVDSGQCGFFDEAMYYVPESVLKNQAWVRRMNAQIKELTTQNRLEEAQKVKQKLLDAIGKLPTDFDDVWYTACCHLTLGDVEAGVIPYGAVSASGYGDGSYDCFVRRELNGEGYMACILYL